MNDKLKQIKQPEILFLFLPAQECSTLKNPRYGQVVLTGTIFGSTATYSCNTGFILVGEQTRTCQANGKWSGRAATCYRKYETSTCTIITMALYFLARFFFFQLWAAAIWKILSTVGWFLLEQMLEQLQLTAVILVLYFWRMRSEDARQMGNGLEGYPSASVSG